MFGQRIEPRSEPDWVVRVPSGEAGRRLDQFLASRSPDHSRSRFKTLILEGRVRVAGGPAKPRYGVKEGDLIEVWFPEPETDDRPVPESLPLQILHEDAHILVVNKAPGMVVHPGAGHREGTLVHGLLAHCPELAQQGSPLRPGIVHRLDQYTSGALVIAKTNASYLRLVRQFKDHQVGKEYLALTYGRFREGSGEIRTLVGRHPRDRKRMAVIERGRGRDAVTRWTVERSWQDELTLLRVVIQTGRTHQIRVHLSHLQHPVVGDTVYGGGKRRARAVQSQTLREVALKIQRQMLHAWRLAFTHPVTRIPMAFTAPLPPDFEDVLTQLDHIEPPPDEIRPR
ncbi:MAG: RluA family pseudouridine synthase [Thermodesulfobacteriota bacterium]|nr:RluA family pseudouridine synthase [Thermodesulfobacteriota bacterium]